MASPVVEMSQGERLNSVPASRFRIPAPVVAFNPRWLTILTLGLPIAIAIGYLSLTLGGRSLWIDDALVAVNVLDGRLDPSSLQTTPVGFFLLLKLSTVFFGSSEFAFRLPAFAFFVAAIGTTSVLARRIYRGTFEAVVAALLLATSFAALTYARAVKPYTADMFLATLIPIVALAIIARPTPRRWIVYGSMLVITPLLSFPALLVSACTALFLFVVLARSYPYRSWLPAWLTTHVIAAFWVAGYGLAFLHGQRSEGLTAFWASGFPPPAGVVRTGLWFGLEYWRLLAWFFTPFFMPAQSAPWRIVDHVVQVASVLLLSLGILALFMRRQAPFVILLLGPAVLLIPVALLHLYPFDPQLGGRLGLYFLPAASVLMAGGLGYVIQPEARSPWRSRGVATAAVLVAIVFAARGLYPLLSDRSIAQVPKEELRDLVTNELIPNLQPGDSIYVYYAAVYGFEYYAPQLRPEVTPDSRELGIFDRDGIHVAYGSAHYGAPYDLSHEADATLGRTGSARMWIVISHFEGDDPQTLTARMSQCGMVQHVWEQAGASLYLVGTDTTTCAAAAGPTPLAGV
jgi:hypothetical protein